MPLRRRRRRGRRPGAGVRRHPPHHATGRCRGRLTMARVLVTDAGARQRDRLHALARPPRRARSSPPTSSAAAPASRRATPAHAWSTPSRATDPDGAVDALHRGRARPRGRPGHPGQRRRRAAALARARALRRAVRAGAARSGRARAGDRQGARRPRWRAGSACRCPRRRWCPPPPRHAPPRPRSAGRSSSSPSRRGSCATRPWSATRSPTSTTEAALDARMMRRSRATPPSCCSSTTPARATASSCSATAASRSPSFQHRRLHEVPITGGASALRESVPVDPVLLDHAAAAAARAALDGAGHGRVPRRARRPGPHGDQRPRLGLAAARRQERRGLPAPSSSSCTSGPEAFGRRRGQRRSRRGSACARATSASSSSGSRPCCARTAATRSCPRPRAPRACARRCACRTPRDGFDVLDRDDPRPGLAELAGVAGRLTRKARHAT